MEDLVTKKILNNHHKREYIFKTSLRLDFERFAKLYATYLLESENRYWLEYLDETTKKSITKETLETLLEAPIIIKLCRLAVLQRMEGFVELPPNLVETLKLLENSLYIVSVIESSSKEESVWGYRGRSPIEQDGFELFIEYGYYNFGYPDIEELEETLKRLKKEITQAELRPKTP